MQDVKKQGNGLEVRGYRKLSECIMQDPTAHYLQETHFKGKNTGKQKIKG